MNGFLIIYITIVVVFGGLFRMTRYQEKHGH